MSCAEDAWRMGARGGAALAGVWGASERRGFAGRGLAGRLYTPRAVLCNCTCPLLPSETASVCSGSLDGVEYSLRKEKGVVKMTVPSTLAFCYLALLWQRETITLSDLLR